MSAGHFGVDAKEGLLVEATMNKLTNEQARRIACRRGERGFTLLQIVIVVAVIAIISTVALLGVASARAGQRRVNSARVLSAYLEKARVDSVRRRADGSAGNPLAAVSVLNANTYSVLLDFDHIGTTSTRTFTLEPGVTFANEAIGVVIQFDWRGRTGGDRLLEVFNSEYPNNPDFLTRVAVSGFGDVTLNDEVYTPIVNSNTSGFASPTPNASATP
ncbi:MAG TPA: hypothetical protein VD835_19480, partial [Pyrinomonadaceae bacterium]|nr:hypothetical protein [Pyrinomonadaceae bacterium]